MKDPQILKWLGEVVGKEGEDLSRHDKWLCMMYPRLRLLQRLLAPTGAIFISIDDNEAAHLRLICNEIFGARCFVADISWQRTYSPRNDSKGIPAEVEHLLVFSKEPGWQPRKLERTAEADTKYKNPDNDYCSWASGDAFAPGAATHQGMVYAVQHPFTGELIYPTAGRHWSLGQEEVLSSFSEWTEYELRDIDDAEKRAELCGIPVDEVRTGVQALMLVKSPEEARLMLRQCTNVVVGLGLILRKTDMAVCVVRFIGIVSEVSCPLTSGTTRQLGTPMPPRKKFALFLGGVWPLILPSLRVWSNVF